MNDFVTQYGKALYSLSKDENKCEKILEELTVIENILEENKEYTKLLDTPAIRVEERTKLISTAFSSFDETVVNFIKILAEKKSTGMLSGCIKEYKKIYDEDNGIERVTVKSAVSLNENQLEKLKEKLEKMLGKKIYIKNEISEDLIGGVLLRLTNNEMDGSVKRKLKDMENHIKALVF